MSHRLEFTENKEREPWTTWAISSYLLIHPFTFDDNNGDLQSLPREARALFGLATVQRPGGYADPPDPQDQPQTAELPRGCDFRVLNGDHEVANLRAFDVHAVSTPSSLDMSRVVIVAHARNAPNTNITATPMPCEYDEFGEDVGSTRYWGTELYTSSDGIMLRASLSVPTYRWDTGCLEEYVALGPANSNGSNGSIFDWLVRHGARPATAQGGSQTQDRALPTLTIRDVVCGVENKLFGGDPSGRAQVRRASGVVFMMNGPLVDVRWRTLARFIRKVAVGGTGRQADGRTGLQNAVDLINSSPETELDQSVRETHLPVLGAGARLGRGGLGVSTPGFEGIMIWGLTARRGEGRVVPVHG